MKEIQAVTSLFLSHSNRIWWNEGEVNKSKKLFLTPNTGIGAAAAAEVGQSWVGSPAVMQLPRGPLSEAIEKQQWSYG